MTTTTTTTYGSDYSHDHQMKGISNYLEGGDYPPEHKAILAAALMTALRNEVDARLPENVSWTPGLSEFAFPVGGWTPIVSGEMDELFMAAWTAVEARFDEIEAACQPPGRRTPN